MVIEGTTRTRSHPRYAGLRLSSDEFANLPDDGFRYELIHGVVLMTPPPFFGHSDLAAEIYAQLLMHVRPRGLGKLLAEPGIRMSASTMYQPDIAYFQGDRAKGIQGHIALPPDLIVECLSPRTRAKDLNTKRNDYEAFGVREYWAIGRDEAWKFVLGDGKYLAEEIKTDRIASEAIPGFVLDLRAARSGSSGSDDGDDIE